MTDEEKLELEELKEKCLKLNSEPRKNAETEDLERLKELVEMVIEPLSDDEREEMDDLERRANGPDREHPEPFEMRRLAGFRKRKDA